MMVSYSSSLCIGIAYLLAGCHVTVLALLDMSALLAMQKDLLAQTIADDELFALQKNLSLKTQLNSVEIVSETNLRKVLFESYMKEVRPAKTVNITVLFYILSINDLDTKSQTLSTTGYFELTWDDPARLSWNSSIFGKVTEVFVEQSKIWIPPLVISNEVNKYSLIADGIVPIRVSSTGRITWSQPRLMETSCSMDIRYYPYDTQVCSILLNPWAYTQQELDLISNGINMMNFVENGEWDVARHSNRKTLDSMGGHQIPVITFELELNRRPSYYVQNIIIPFVVMSFLYPAVFILPAESGERVSFIVTVFLAVVVMLTLIADQLPAASKKPAILSEFLTFMTVNASLVVLLTIMNLLLYHRDDTKPVPEWLKKLTRVLGRIMLQKKPTQNKVEPEEIEKGDNCDEQPPMDEDKESTCSKADEPTWKDVCEVLDMFYFRLLLCLTVVCASSLILTLLFH